MSNYPALWLQKYKSSAVALLITIFCIRFFQVLLNFSAEFGGLFRPQPVSSAYAGLWLFLSATLLLVLLTAKMRHLAPPLQNRILLFLVSEYFLIALFHNKIGKRSFICELLDGNLSFDELINLYSLDFLFQAPGYLWGLAWCAVSFALARKSGVRYVLPVLWIPVLLPLSVSDDAFPAIFSVAVAIGATACYFCCKKHGSSKLHLWWTISFPGLLLLLNDSSAIYRNSWLVALLLFLPAWLPGLLLAAGLEKTDNPDANSASWLTTSLSGIAFVVILTNVPLARNLFNLWFSMASLHFASWAVIPVLITITMITVAGSIHPRLTRPTFFIAAGILLSFYLIDAIVMFKTGLRLTYNTLDWVLGLSRLSSLAGTIGSMNGIGTILMLFFAPPLVFRYSMQISASKDAIARLAPFLLFALATSLSCQFFGVISPGLFKDPVMVLFSSFASLTADRNSFKSIEELAKSFKECGLTTLTYDKPTSEPGRTAAKKNLILIMLESTTNRYVSLFGHREQTWPELEKYKDRMEIFPFFFSCFPESSNADFV